MYLEGLRGGRPIAADLYPGLGRSEPAWGGSADAPAWGSGTSEIIGTMMTFGGAQKKKAKAQAAAEQARIASGADVEKFRITSEQAVAIAQIQAWLEAQRAEVESRRFVEQARIEAEARAREAVLEAERQSALQVARQRAIEQWAAQLGTQYEQRVSPEASGALLDQMFTCLLKGGAWDGLACETKRTF